MPSKATELGFSRERLILAILAVLAVLIVTRSYIVTASPKFDKLDDIGIYREVGKLVVSGIDPYDMKSRLAEREAHRLDNQGMSGWSAATANSYNYYVSGNFPGSSLLFGMIEWGTGGEVTNWRKALILGDVFLALAIFGLLLGSNIRPAQAIDFATAAAMVVAYPSLVAQGTLASEDKQFQIAAMLGVVAIGLGARGHAMSLLRAAALGALFAFSISFKVLGVALLPFVICLFIGRPIHVAATFAVSAALVLAISFLPFSSTFLSLMYSRFTTASALGAAPAHASPWALLAGHYAPVAKLIVCGGLAGLSTWLLYARRIDLLNWIASGLVIYLCLWAINGAMNRMNMAMIFAAMCVWSLDRVSWRQLIWVNLAAQLALYGYRAVHAGSIYALYDLPTDRIATCIFVVSYFIILSMAPRRDQSAWSECRNAAPMATAPK